MAIRGRGEKGERVLPPAVAAATRLPARADIAWTGIATVGVGGDSRGLGLVGVFARAGGRGAAAQSIVCTCACFHAVDLCLDMVRAIGTNVRNFQSACIRAHEVRIPLGAEMLPERDLCVTCPDNTYRAGGRQEPSHRVAQE